MNFGILLICIHVIMCLNFQPDKSPVIIKSEGLHFCQPRAWDWISDVDQGRVKYHVINDWETQGGNGSEGQMYLVSWGLEYTHTIISC